MSEIAEYSFVEEALNELSIQYQDVPDASTDEGYDACKVGAKAVGKYRIALEAKRKEIKGPALEKCKAIDEEAKRIQLVIAEIEEPLKLAYKDVDVENKRLEEERVSGILAIIEGMTVFIDMAKTGTIETISEWIEQVEDIDCSDKNMFAEFSKDAALERNRVLEALQIELRRTIQQEADEKKRKEQELELEELKIKQEEADEKIRKAEADQKITDRINELRMKPTNFIGKSSTVINAQIVTLSRFMVTEEEFGDRMPEVISAVELVISQLQLIQTQAEQMEYVDKVEADKKAELEKEEANKEEPEPTGMLCGTYKKEPVDDIPIEQTLEESQEETATCGNYQDIKGFLEWASLNQDALEDFEYLLVSCDPMHDAESLGNIRRKFECYVTD